MSFSGLPAHCLGAGGSQLPQPTVKHRLSLAAGGGGVSLLVLPDTPHSSGQRRKSAASGPGLGDELKVRVLRRSGEIAERGRNSAERSGEIAERSGEIAERSGEIAERN